jgi:phage baseplate assembly protein W
MANEKKISKGSFLGTGWSFPPSFSRAEEGAVMVSDEEDIQQSLQILLSTSLGERLMEPAYGCNLNRFLFEPMDNSLRTYMEDTIKTAILYHEARIDLHQVILDLDNYAEGVLMINIVYTIRGTNSRFNLVYPYYLEEGVGVEASTKQH